MDAESSWIESMEYDHPRHQARIILRAGRCYTIQGLSLSNWHAWLRASSRGTYFNRRIKTNPTFAITETLF